MRLCLFVVSEDMDSSVTDSTQRNSTPGLASSFESAVPCPLDRLVDYHPPLMPVLRQVLGDVWPVPQPCGRAIGDLEEGQDFEFISVMFSGT